MLILLDRSNREKMKIKTKQKNYAWHIKNETLPGSLNVIVVKIKEYQ